MFSDTEKKCSICQRDLTIEVKQNYKWEHFKNMIFLKAEQLLRLTARSLFALSEDPSRRERNLNDLWPVNLPRADDSKLGGPEGEKHDLE